MHAPSLEKKNRSTESSSQPRPSGHAWKLCGSSRRSTTDTYWPPGIEPEFVRKIIIEAAILQLCITVTETVCASTAAPQAATQPPGPGRDKTYIVQLPEGSWEDLNTIEWTMAQTRQPLTVLIAVKHGQ